MDKRIKSIEKYRFNTYIDGQNEESIEVSGEIISKTESEMIQFFY